MAGSFTKHASQNISTSWWLYFWVMLKHVLAPKIKPTHRAVCITTFLFRSFVLLLCSEKTRLSNQFWETSAPNVRASYAMSLWLFGALHSWEGAHWKQSIETTLLNFRHGGWLRVITFLQRVIICSIDREIYFKTESLGTIQGHTRPL